MCSGEKNDDGNNDEKEAHDQGPDVEALGGGHIALGPSHNTPHFRVPKLQGAGECHEARVAGIHEECVLNRDQTTRLAMAGHVMLIMVALWAPRSGASLAGQFPVPPGASHAGGLQYGQQ